MAQIILHSILRLTHDEYSQVTSISNLTSKFRGGNSPTVPPPTPPSSLQNSSSLSSEALIIDVGSHPGFPDESKTRANATLLMLARNSDLEGVIQSVREIEDRFNKKYGYPWVFLNEVAFTEEFIK